jgi:eukaryotic-like serine/threonine-protein kinase
MRNPHFIGRVPDSTPAAPGTSTKRVRALPHDLLKEASRRLGIMSLLAAALWLLATVLYQVALRQMDLANRVPTQLTDAIAMANALVSLALFFYIRRDTRNPSFILNLGLVYMVFTALSLGMIFHWYPPPPGWQLTPNISWIGAVFLIFAAIVPNAPSKILLVGVTSVSMNPLGMLLAQARGTWNFGSASNALLMHYPDYLLVGAAVVISSVVTKLGQQVTKAREMGSYRLDTMLGKGGMGEVWRASHRMLARDAAIKLIQPDMLIRTSGKEAAILQRRFEQEARTTASLRSPHTVELYDFGRRRTLVEGQHSRTDPTFS